jgi:CheY-like chemotaxis protein
VLHCSTQLGEGELLVAERKRVAMSAKILIVEDESIVALHLSNQMRQCGYSVVATVTSGEAALSQCMLIRPDLVLMDIRLQGEMNGLQAGLEIQKRYAIPVLYLTAYAEQLTMVQSHSHAEIAYLAKPFKESDLYEIVTSLLGDQG